MRVPLHKVGQNEIRLAEAVRIPDRESPEGKLFRALQAVFDEMGADERPTPMRRRHLHEAANHAVNIYFVEKLAATSVQYPSAHNRRKKEGGI